VAREKELEGGRRGKGGYREGRKEEDAQCSLSKGEGKRLVFEGLGKKSQGESKLPFSLPWTQRRTSKGSVKRGGLLSRLN